MTRVFGTVILGLICTLLSTMVGERTATASYPEVMGCEVSCEVVATGWPFVFVRDYPGMSVVNTADISEVVFAADRLNWIALSADSAFWSLVSWLVLRLTRRATRERLAGSLFARKAPGS